MKGVTAIIAIILLLMITISMVGFAFVWFQRIGTSLTTSIENQTTAETQKAGKLVSIDNINKIGGNLTVRHIGIVNIPVSEILVYANGTVPVSTAECGWSGNLAVGGFVTCNNAKIIGCTSIKVTAPGNIDQRSC